MVAITDITALSLWAHNGLKKWLDAPMSGNGLGWSAASASELWGCGLEELGIRATKAHPVHILVDCQEHRIQSQLVKNHVWTGTLPAGSLYRLAPGVLLASPGLCVLQAAASSGIPRAAAVAMECMGRYGCVTDEREFLKRDPLLSREELRGYLDGVKVGSWARRARRALDLALENSRSPLETRAALTLTLPVALGGYALPRPEMNHLIVPRAEDYPYSQYAQYEVDMCWPERRTVIEVDSYEFHLNKDKLDTDAKKRNSLKAMGWAVSSVTAGQLSGDALDVLVRQISRDLGVFGGSPPPGRRDALVDRLSSS